MGILSKRIIVAIIASSLAVMAFIPFNKGQLVKQKLYSSIVWVESKGNSNATTKDGSAGIVQIKPIMVREVNRIQKLKGREMRYTLQDRFDDTKSKEMFWIYQNFYHPNVNWDSVTVRQLELMARRWNGGPNGDKKEATVKYWRKVLKRLHKEFDVSSDV